MTTTGGHADEIRRNIRTSRVLLTANIVVLGTTGAVLASPFGDPAAGITAAVFMALGYASSRAVSAAFGFVAGARPAGTAPPQAQSMLAAVALAAGIPTPTLHLVNDPEPNAFAWGRKPQNSHVAVTTGLLYQLSPREVEAVLAHEVAHIANRDSAMMTIGFSCYGLLFVLAALGSVIVRWAGDASAKRDNDAAPFIGVLVLCPTLVVLPAMLLSWLLHLATSREREALADVTAVHYLGSPVQLRRALEAISLHPARERRGPVAAMCIHRPTKHGTLNATHPPMAWRIARLRQLEGLDPDQPTTPGWYADPWHTATYRWFDGTNWTGYTS